MKLRYSLTGILLLLMVVPAPGYSLTQSLADAARKEAERRENLEREGISGKVIEGQDPASLAPRGNLSIFAPVPRRTISKKTEVSRERGSPTSFRTALQRLNREIKKIEDQLILLRRRASAERWALPKTGRPLRNARQSSSEERLSVQIQELEAKLKRLRQDRIEVYDTGRKAGFLPGELDGKGIVP